MGQERQRYFFECFCMEAKLGLMKRDDLDLLEAQKNGINERHHRGVTGWDSKVKIKTIEALMEGYMADS